MLNFNVMDYGAAGNGVADDTLAFIKAWNATCSSSTGALLTIPKEKTFFLNPTKFTGPCKASEVTVMLSGNLVAPDGPKAWKLEDKSTWLYFQGVEGMTVTGNGQINGRGKGWWDISCRYHPGSSLRFQDCGNLHVDHIKIYDSPQTHISLAGCHGAELSSINIDSPDSSPNTDGIHISACNNVNIHTSKIGSGLGGSVVDVQNITVQRANFSGTTNGARIKTRQEGKGSVRNIHFSDLNFNAVENPIIIDQHYGDNEARGGLKAGVSISGVTYSRARGTSKTPVAINLNCSSSVACTGITLDTIQLAPAAKARTLSSFCNNAHGTAIGAVYVPRLDDPHSRTFESCSTDKFQINGPCTYQICYLYLYRSGYDGWKPESITVSGYYTSPITFYYNTFIPNGVHKGFIYWRFIDDTQREDIFPESYKIYRPLQSQQSHYYGNLVAPDGPKAWKLEDKSTWLHFQGVEGLTVTGNGQINGRGKGWWDISCRYHPGSSLRFQDCGNLHVDHIKIYDSPQTHISLTGCHGTELSSINIDSPDKSPNTDGIHISACNDVNIHTSKIGSGLGGSVVDVQNITVQRANFSGTTNGARIKTRQEGKGSVRNIHFIDLNFNNVENPIIIDQHYASEEATHLKAAGVSISGVTYSRARGTSKTPVAINLNCSSTVPCTDITLDTIQLAPAAKAQKLSSYSNNAHVTAIGAVNPFLSGAVKIDK
ncbi:hypothetical protein Tsubulata_050320 [Turnera subulata]|uniref:Polygalacturonase n=1 Tax=Turnera subulata TaxID=218843 RepID=A0A9Q0F914_9ROSI|nr:hypothetical protein Tsubulata_050320 [Turnera subulata]